MGEKESDTDVENNANVENTSVIEDTASFEKNPKQGRRKNIITAVIAAGTFAALMFGGYLLNRHSHEVKITPRTEIKSEVIESPKIKKGTIITANRNWVDTVYVKKGDTAWDIIRDNYRLSDDLTISRKINDVADFNHTRGQSEAMLDNRAIIAGKVVNTADGIRFDHMHIGSRMLLPKTQRDDIAINYFKDDAGNLYDENQRPITYDDLKEEVRKRLGMKNGDVTYDMDPKSDPLLTMILTSLDGKKERLNTLFKLVDNNLEKMTSPGSTKQDLALSRNIASIVDENTNPSAGGDDPHDDAAYLRSDWNRYMDGKYSYAKLKSSQNKQDLMAYLVNTYKNHTVKEAASILGMSRYQLYKALDMEYGKGMMRKRPSSLNAA